MPDETLIDPPAGDPPAGDPPAGDPPSNQRPEWLPEKFWGEEGPNVEALAKSYATLERTRANPDELKAQWEQERLAGRPESPDKYELPDDEVFDPEALASSPVVDLWRKAAHEAGIGQDKFKEVLGEYAKGELERIEARRTEELTRLGENAKARTEAVGLWASKLFGEGEKFEAVAQICTTAAGVEAIEQLMGMTRDAMPSGDDFEGPAGEPTLEEIRQKMDTPQYWDPQRRDPKVVAEVEAFFKKRAGKK